MRLGLSVKLIIYLAFLLAATGVLSSGVAIWVLRANLADERVVGIEKFSSLTASAVSAYLHADPTAEVLRFNIDRLTAGNWPSAVAVFGEDGRLLAESPAGGAAGLRPSADVGFRDSPAGRQLLFNQPVRLRGDAAGSVVMAFPISGPGGVVVKFESLIIYYAGLNVLIILLFGAFMMQRKFVRPLTSIFKSVETAASGELLAMLDSTPRDELGRLSLSFENMLRQLAERERRLQDSIAELKKVNEELRRTQAELVRSEKLALVGRIASGVAHEVGNPLAAIQGYVNILQAHRMTEAERQDCFRNVISGIERIDRIIRDLLSFARPKPLDLQPIDVNAATRSAVEFLMHSRKFSGRPVRLDLGADLPMVRGDAARLGQVLVNLLVNAADAIAQGGEIAIRTSLSRPAAEDERPWIVLAVRDTGKGMPKENLGSIFDPFFTTKAEGDGTGLGLFICHQLVEQMGGRISVESAPGEGTTFKVRLRLAGEPSLVS